MKKNSCVKAFLVFALIAMTSVPVFAKNWIQIGEGHYIDVDSIRPASTYGAYNYTTKYLAKSVPLDKAYGREIWTLTTSSYIDCRSNYAKTISYTGLDANDNKVVSGRKVGKQWFGINNPGSRAYESYAFICTDKYLHVHPGYNRFWWY